MPLKHRKRNNILYLAEGVSLHSKLGDLTHVVNFIEALLKKELNITLIIRGKKAHKNLISERLTIVKLPAWLFPYSIFTHLIALIVITLVALIKKPKFIYQRDTGINSGIVIAKLLRIPVFLEINGDVLQQNQNAPYSKLLQCVVRFTYSKADLVIVHSANNLSNLRSYKINWKKATIVPNGVNPSKFRIIKKDVCRARLNLQESCFYFGFVGNLAPWQGLETAIISFSKLLKEKKNGNIKLLIVGEGALEKKLKKLVSNLRIDKHVLFPGGISHNIIPYVINACDVCIAPFTSWRNKKLGLSPLKLLEYLSCGKPVIASVVPGTELVEKLNAGILVKPDDVDALKYAYSKAIQNLQRWENEANIIHKEIAANYSWDKIVECTLKVVSEVLNE